MPERLFLREHRQEQSNSWNREEQPERISPIKHIFQLWKASSLPALPIGREKLKISQL